MGLKDSNHIILYEGQNPRVNCAFNGIREVGEGDRGWCGSHSNTLPFHSLLLLIWLGKESSEAEGKQECAWILRVWKVRDWEVVNHHACKSGRKTEDRWKNDHWLWQHQGDRQPCSESFRGMWTKVQWVRGVKREWGSTDNSLQDFCYMVEKEVRLRGFYFKTGEKVASL